jgi:hypothetical protein
MMQDVAKETGMVLIVPIYEEEMSGVYYNSAAVIDADGKYLGKYRKTHIPHVNPGFGKSFIFVRAISAIRVLTRRLPASAFIFATTVIFQKARDVWFKRRGDYF